jgi:propanol-preferring alcohol dehydrogenase
MKAMLLEELGPVVEGSPTLRLADVPPPAPHEGEVLVRVSVCGVCHTELDEIEGRLPPAHLPLVLGHQVIGRVESGRGAGTFKAGDRVGVAWIYSACGRCKFCRSGRENLCPEFKGTGRDANGGYAEFMTVQEDFTHPIPDVFADAEAAPLLCAGAIGFRSLSLAGIQDGDRLGLTGFGASGHLVLKMARHLFPRTEVYVFARRQEERAFATELGAAWAGDPSEHSPEPLAAIIDTTPAWKPIVDALRNLAPGGQLVINAIRKEPGDLASLTDLDYATHLWLEKGIRSVANVTRADVRGFLGLAAEASIRPEVQIYPLEEANRALWDLKQRRSRGAKVLQVGPPARSAGA